MLENLYKIWTRLGVGFNESFSKEGSIDLEKILVETAHAGREDSRLLFGMRGWLLKHHDLVNGSRLIRFLKEEKETAVLGAIVDSVVEQEPRSVLLSVKRYCKKRKEPEFVFSKIAQSKVESKVNRLENHPVWKRWNLISNEMSVMEGAIHEKNYVLKHNPNLALRALFGAGTRAEIFSFFLKQKEANASEIARALNQSYQPVYSELMAVCKIGLGQVKKVGAESIFHVSSKFLKILLKSFTRIFFIFHTL